MINYDDTKTCGEKNHTDRDIKSIHTILFLVLFFMVIEFWGHYHSNSLSLLADCIHLFVDILGFLISIIALKWTKKPENNKMTFGYHRIEAIGALFSIFFIWAATGYLIIEAYQRYNNPQAIKEKIFIGISLIGFIVNVICLYWLHRNTHSHGNEKSSLNIRATYVHVIGDVVQSTGVIIAALIIFFYPTLIIVDITCTIIFAILVLISTISVLKDVFSILSESVPTGINILNIKNDLLHIKGIKEIIDIKVWSISVNIHACMTSILVEDVFLYEYEELLLKAKKILRKTYHMHYVNVQIETNNTIEFFNI
ncbi:Cation efflux protein [Spraguea lophii 42_110]|uniref:Cation efflux protein n=1 Tax=Spraguea lophii (strain 42_110) TaxID=1358809 RepID=S7XJT9_SPRLO|nr:Cation efflux protein [Spraguea lophii 42_110]